MIVRYVCPACGGLCCVLPRENDRKAPHYATYAHTCTECLDGLTTPALFHGSTSHKEPSMRAIPNNAPSNVAALDDRDPNAGNASHTYGIQYGGPKDVVKIPFQHGPRGVEGSTPGVFDDDLLAIIEDRLVGFQSGPFACEENGYALTAVREARAWLGRRVARRIAQGVLGLNANHTPEKP